MLTPPHRPLRLQRVSAQHRVTGSAGGGGTLHPHKAPPRRTGPASGIHRGPVPWGQSLKLLPGKSRCPSARLSALVCPHGQGWALVSDGAARLAAGPCAFVLLSDLGDAGLHPAGVFRTQDFSKALFTLGLPVQVRPEEGKGNFITFLFSIWKEAAGSWFQDCRADISVLTEVQSLQWRLF